MTEPASSSIAGIALAKAGLAGAVAAGLMFAVLWPKTPREGVSRIVCTIAGSVLFGRPLLAYVHSIAAWWPNEHEADMAVYVMAGLPAWWLLGGFARWFEKRKRKDLGQMAADLADDIKRVKGQ